MILPSSWQCKSQDEVKSVRCISGTRTDYAEKPKGGEVLQNENKGGEAKVTPPEILCQKSGIILPSSADI